MNCKAPIFFGMLLFSCACVPAQANDWQKFAEKQPWEWDGEKAALMYSVYQHLGDHQVEVISPKWVGEDPQPYNNLTVRIFAERKEIYSFKAHRGTVFSRVGSVLYITDYCPIGSGCSVFAYDLETKKELWRSRLQSISHWSHSVYRNAVTIENRGDVLVVRGKEELLKYVEYVDMKTGKTLAQKEYPWQEK